MWINTVIHRVMPAVMLADWLLLPPRHRIERGTALLWLLYPLGYAAYTAALALLVAWAGNARRARGVASAA